MKNATNNPEAIRAALAHVKSVFPQVKQVRFDEYGDWIYSDLDGNAPDFGDEIIIDILDAASRSLQCYNPVVFTLSDDGALSVVHETV